MCEYMYRFICVYVYVCMYVCRCLYVYVPGRCICVSVYIHAGVRVNECNQIDRAYVLICDMLCCSTVP